MLSHTNSEVVGILQRSYGYQGIDTPLKKRGGQYSSDATFELRMTVFNAFLEMDRYKNLKL